MQYAWFCFAQMCLYNKRNKDNGDSTDPSTKQLQTVATVAVFDFTIVIVIYYTFVLGIYSLETISNIIYPLLIASFLMSYTLLLSFHFLRLLMLL